MGSFLAPLNVVLYYTFVDVLIAFSIFWEIIFKRKTQKIWFCSWKLKLSMQSSYFVSLSNSHKKVFQKFYDDTPLGFGSL